MGNLSDEEDSEAGEAGEEEADDVGAGHDPLHQRPEQDGAEVEQARPVHRVHRPRRRRHLRDRLPTSGRAGRRWKRERGRRQEWDGEGTLVMCFRL